MINPESIPAQQGPMGGFRPEALACGSATAPIAQWHEHHFRAMNTTVYLSLYTANAGLGRYVETFFAHSEARLSRFRGDSELNKLNQSPRSDNPVSPELLEILQAARWANQATDGLFDPTILPHLESAGYDRSFEQLKEAPPAASVVTPTTGANPGFAMSAMVLDPAGRRVRRPVGMRLDLGGIGKGWTVDRCADLLQHEGPFLLNAGGDLYAHGAPAPHNGWEIEIEDALNPAASVATLLVADTAMATSTVVGRRWQQGTQARHHIIDPRTNAPAVTDLLAVTVLAPRVTLAETYAKCALILGSGPGKAFLAARGVDGLFQTQDGEVHATAGVMDRLIALGGMEQQEGVYA
jgi:thiamine biosynthesis lipoprotein